MTKILPPLPPFFPPRDCVATRDFAKDVMNLGLMKIRLGSASQEINRP
jgi:hypothetical protein